MRAAVVVGCTALLLGVAGVFHFAGRDRARSGLRPRDVARVYVAGVRAEEDLDVVVRWPAPDGGRGEERGEPGAEPHTWLFRRAPQGVPVDLTVVPRGAADPAPVWRQPAWLTRGGLFEVVLPAR